MLFSVFAAFVHPHIRLPCASPTAPGVYLARELSGHTTQVTVLVVGRLGVSLPRAKSKRHLGNLNFGEVSHWKGGAVILVRFWLVIQPFRES